MPKITILKTRYVREAVSKILFFSHAFSEQLHRQNFNDCLASHFFPSLIMFAVCFNQKKESLQKNKYVIAPLPSSNYLLTNNSRIRRKGGD